MSSENVKDQMVDFEEVVEDVKESSGGLSFEVVLEAPKTEEPEAVKQTRSGGNTPRKEELDAKMQKAEERRKEFLENKLESVKQDEERRLEAQQKLNAEEQEKIEKTKKKLEERFVQMERNKEAELKKIEEACKEEQRRIDEAQKRAAAAHAANPTGQPLLENVA